jgi:RNA binding exosome subunit
LYSSLDISILIHATENENRVLKSVLEFIEKPIESVKMDSVKTEGHWKNPILRFTVSVNMDVDKILDKLYSSLVKSYGETDVKNYIEHNTDEKGYLYVRLDKQKFCSGKIILSDKDSVRMVFKKIAKFKL